MNDSLFPLAVGIGAVAIAFNMTNPTDNYDDYRDHPGYEAEKGLGNDHMDVGYFMRLATYVNQTTDPQRYFSHLDLHDKFRRNYENDFGNGGSEDAVYYKAREGSGIVGELMIRGLEYAI